ncbi:hypothetical protein GCM10011390_45970 [Aureimonas endophytica]|uniref:ribonuclease H n=1 Tax=Aureimonas endophytica TaxID=2027858 RepID=A0A917A0X7_9HYPH|nr:ribonuclease H [Aureimonas endophytica]GGE21447.1 hypothetical protein GCM10011390_45970 [Aureimonas endophytica]
MKHRPITEAEIEAGKSPTGGFSYARLRSWGVRCPPRAGWRRKLVRAGVPAACPYPEGFVPAASDFAVPMNPLLGAPPAAPAAPPPDALQIFTDGSCEAMAGGWGLAVYREGAELHAACGGEAATTNNRMELRAVIEALRWLEPDRPALLWTDSQYVARGAEEWRRGWRKARWTREGRGALAHADLWEELGALLATRPVEIGWTRGHADTPGNERADALAALGRRWTLRKAGLRRNPSSRPG